MIGERLPFNIGQLEKRESRIGCRFSLPLPLEVLLIAAKACDVIAAPQSVQHQNAPVGTRAHFWH